MLSRLRWIMACPGAAYRDLEQIVANACDPALAALREHDLIESAYVSKKGNEVWLTVFSERAEDVAATTEHYVKPYSSRSDHTSDPDLEEMLQSKCGKFRKCLDKMTSIALEIHRDTDLQLRQKELIRIGRVSRDSRQLLESFLARNSETFRQLRDPETFWVNLGCNCLSSRTDCLHWLYNIVLGFDWEWHLSEQAIFQRLGLSWP